MRAKTKYRTVGVKGQGGVTRGFAYNILQHRNQLVVFEVLCFVSLSPHGLAYCCACFAPRFASCSVLSALRLLRSEKRISAESPLQLSSPRALESCNSEVPGYLRVAARVVKIQTSPRG